MICPHCKISFTVCFSVPTHCLECRQPLDSPIIRKGIGVNNPPTLPLANPGDLLDIQGLA